MRRVWALVIQGFCIMVIALFVLLRLWDQGWISWAWLDPLQRWYTLGGRTMAMALAAIFWIIETAVPQRQDGGLASLAMRMAQHRMGRRIRMAAEIAHGAQAQFQIFPLIAQQGQKGFAVILRTVGDEFHHGHHHLAAPGIFVPPEARRQRLAVAREIRQPVGQQLVVVKISAVVEQLQGRFHGLRVA